MKKRKDYYNVKVTVYLNRDLESRIIENAEKRDKGFSESIRYLIEKGLEEAASCAADEQVE